MVASRVGRFVKSTFYLVNHVCVRSAAVCDERVKNGHFINVLLFYAPSFPVDISPVRETVDIETSADRDLLIGRMIGAL